MEGWIKLHRQLSENPLWLIKPFSEGQAWVDLLLITTFDKGFIKTKNGTIIKLNRGECGYSVLTLSQRWGWSRGKVTRFLSFLKNEEMIQQKIVSNTTIINILNYENYQNDTINDTINSAINGQQTDTIKNVKNVKNDNSTISYINISLSIEERELLKKYLLTKPRKEPIYDWDAYFALMNRNGTLKIKLEKAKKWAENKRKKEVILEEEVSAEETQEAIKRSHEYLKQRGIICKRK